MTPTVFELSPFCLAKSEQISIGINWLDSFLIGQKLTELLFFDLRAMANGRLSADKMWIGRL